VNIFILIIAVLLPLQILVFYFSHKQFSLLNLSLKLLEKTKYQEDQLETLILTEVVPDFNLQSIRNETISLDSLIIDKPLILLIADSKCSACSFDLIEFSEESNLFGEFYNFVLIVNNDYPIDEFSALTNGSKAKQRFNNILYYDETFIKNYKISMLPTFMMINSKKQLVSLPAMTSHFRSYYRPEHLKLVNV